MQSGIYKGAVRHKRYSPVEHQFIYKVFMLYLDLDELQEVFEGTALWSAKRRNLAYLKRSDFHGDPERSIKESVLKSVKQQLGFEPGGPVRMLANVRMLGYVMNPLVTYYCYAADGVSLEAILAEVNNTPWNEKHAYALRVDPDASERSFEYVFQKQFTVSPFNTLDMMYRWKSNAPGRRIKIHIENLRQGDKVTDATLCLKREEITSARLNASILQFPFHTFKTVAAIYWQALMLYLKKVPFYGKDKIFSASSG